MEPIERRTYDLHVRAAMFEGAFNAVVASASDVATKNLGIGPYEVMLITMAPSVAQLSSLVLARLIEAGDRRSLFLYPAVLGRLPLSLLLFTSDPWVFIVLLVLQSFAAVPIIYAVNSLFRVNYRDEVRSTLYSRAARFGHIAAGIVLVGFGYWLEREPRAFQWVFPLAALAGGIACYFFARMPVPPGATPSVGAARVDVLFAARILSRDRLFRIYEIGFFVYGLGFMTGITAKPLFAVNQLKLSNQELLWARALFSVVIVLATPWMGRVMNRLNAAGLSGLCCAALSLQALILALAEGAAAYFVAEAIFGLGMAGILVTWNIGPVNFATPGEAMRYMGVHVALVGVRGLIGHPAGALIAEHSQPRYAFPVACVLFAAAAVIMFRLRPRLVPRS